MANHDYRTARARSSSRTLAKNLPEGPSCFEVRNRAGLVLSQLASLRLPLSIVHWSIVVQALVNPTMRGPKTCSELPPRTHLLHGRRELPRSMCCRFRSGRARKEAKSQKPCNMPKSCDPSVLWRSATVQRRPPGAVPGRHAKNSSWRTARRPSGQPESEMVPVWLLVCPPDP